jgi:hypothetical protein
MSSEASPTREFALSSLATSLSLAPGVTAVLAGSGLSRAAGVPTGWDIMTDLVVRVAKASEANDDAENARVDPEGWWSHLTGEPLRWSALLERLASTQGSRQALIESYFEPESDSRVDSPAHRTIARFVAQGRIRVILTTNFDRLLERHLAEHGVEAQVIDSESAVRGMTPLVHSRATVVKLHGDYRSLATLNTDQEVSEYGPEMGHLLDQVLDEFGLLVVGWSAQWDPALRDAIRASANRRYQLFWATHNGHLSEEAQALVVQRGQVIDIDDAGTFLVDLARRVERIERTQVAASALSIIRELLIPPTDWLEPTDAGEPTLHMMVGATLAFEPEDRDILITPAMRDEVLAALSRHRLTRGATNLANDWGYGMERAPSSHRGLTWQEEPNGYQSLEVASYVLRSDDAAVDSALLHLRTRSITLPPAQMRVILSVSAPVHDSPLPIEEALKALVDLADAAAVTVPAAISMEAGAAVDATDVTMVLGSQLRPQYRPEIRKIVEVVQLEMFGAPGSRLRDHLAASIRLNQPAESVNFRELTIDVLEHTLLSSGWTDPRQGFRRLRDRLAEAER